MLYKQSPEFQTRHWLLVRKVYIQVHHRIDKNHYSPLVFSRLSFQLRNKMNNCKAKADFCHHSHIDNTTATWAYTKIESEVTHWRNRKSWFCFAIIIRGHSMSKCRNSFLERYVVNTLLIHVKIKNELHWNNLITLVGQKLTGNEYLR